jgi:GAF domain-containing protein
LGAEVALASACGICFFTLLAIPVAVADSRLLPVLLLAVAGIAAVTAMFRFWGVAYAVPAAVGGLLAFDWFYIPPPHPHAFPDTQSFVDLLVFLAVGVLVGELAARAGRRAATSELARSELADEQAALRRVATLVAQGASPPEVFAAVTEEVGWLLPVDFASMARYEPGDTVVAIGAWGHTVDRFPVGSRWPLEGKNVTTEVAKTGRPIRIDRYDETSGMIGASGRDSGFRAVVGTPIVVEGRLWGVISVGSTRAEPPLPAGTEARLAQFTELLATAIANAENRAELARLAEEQAALRRVATLVAQGASPPDVFAAVTEEVGRLLPVDMALMGCYEPDDTIVALGAWGAPVAGFAVGTRWSLEGKNVSTEVAKTGRPSRIDRYDDASGGIGDVGRKSGFRSAVGTPIVVEGRLWGVMVVGSNRPEPPLPAGIEDRLAQFTELSATAVANAESRAELARLAEEQAALRRVATLVARGTPPEQLFAAVTKELGQLLCVDHARLSRFEPDGTTMTLVGLWGKAGNPIPPGGHRQALGGKNVSTIVFETGGAARIDGYGDASGPLGAAAREDGLTSGVGTPIVVEGQLWGAMTVFSGSEQPLPADTEARLASFSGLVATAVANAQSSAALAASRARIVAAADDERRRVVRDLHDGAQQRLVHTVVTLQMASQALEDRQKDVPALLHEALGQAEQATDELRKLAHGIMPSVLTRGGLRAGVDALAAQMPVPVEAGVSVDRLPAAIEATAYFIVAEALTNVVKHSQADHAAVTARLENGMLQLQVRDDGIGGARADGSGLVGLADRVAALDGSLRLESPDGGGTLVAAHIPVRQAA